jgi:hypothetical protein
MAFSPLPELQAATLVSPGSQPGSDKLVQPVKMKKKKGYKKAGKRKAGKRKGRRAAGKGRSCGTYKYWKREQVHGRTEQVTPFSWRSEQGFGRLISFVESVANASIGAISTPIRRHADTSAVSQMPRA